jgi:hypothetical protein
MFTCIISIDTSDDDYILRLNISFDNKKICDDTIKIINQRKYSTDFIKNVTSHMNETSECENSNSTFFKTSEEALDFFQNFLDEYDTLSIIDRHIKKKYKVYQTQFSEIFKEKMNNFHDSSDSDDDYVEYF